MGVRHYYLVDLENVGLSGLYGLNLPDEGSEIQIFFSESACTTTAEARDDILASKANVRLFHCKANGKNALDFELAAYFGSILERPETERVSIISKDKGFHTLKDYANHKRKEVIVSQEKSILEAYVIAETDLQPRFYKSGNTVDLKSVAKQLSGSSTAESKVRRRLSAYPKEVIEGALEILSQENATRQKMYIGFMKRFGKKKGTEIYSKVREVLNG